MNKIFKLTKVFLKTSFTQFKGTSKPKTISKKIMQIIGIILLIGYIIGIFGFISYEMIDTLNQAGQPALFLGIALLSIAILLLIQTLISSMNLFYFSKDIEYILPLPLKPYEIVVAKFNTLLITEYVTVFMFLALPFIIYGILTQATAVFYLYAILVLLIFPILPALISSFIVMIAMSFSGITKNKDRFQTIATVVLIIFVILMQIQMTGSEETSDEEIIQMLTQFNGLVDKIDDYFITLGDSINVLLNYYNTNGFISLIKLIIITVFAYLVFIFAAQKIYFKGAIGATYSGKKKKSYNKVETLYKRQKIVTSYVKKEFISLLKNPIFFTQCILPAILMPVIMAVSGIAGAGGLEELKANGIESLEISNTIGLCVIIGINVLLFSMNFIPVTAISRDGENAVFMKYIPLELSKQCTYKIIPAIIMDMISILILEILAIILFKTTILFVILSVMISVLLSILYSYIMIIVDLKRPKLKWDSEYAVVKQNLNMIWGFILSFSIIILLILISIVFTNVTYIIPSALLIIAILFGIYNLRKYIDKNQIKLFEKVQ